ncbi:IS5 family transposase [Streptomyces sp. KL116D]|uniref:IS5 family transposase n=1 Tax=Streptomyces sp. KL116D TaxID=3045152 RepID=UPI0035592E81
MPQPTAPAANASLTSLYEPSLRRRRRGTSLGSEAAPCQSLTAPASATDPASTRGVRWLVQWAAGRSHPDKATVLARRSLIVQAVFEICRVPVAQGFVESSVSGVGGGYPSDLTDEQWVLVEPLLPRARVGPKGGRREKHPRRRIVDAIFYVVRMGCAWRQLPKDFAPWPTGFWYFTWWHDDGTVERIHDALRGKVREADGRDAEPSAGLIDSQSVRTADTVRASTRGFDAGKRVKGRKRFIVTDTLGLLLAVHVVAASVQDRDGGKRRFAVDQTRPPERQEGLGRPGLRRPLGRVGRADPRPRSGDRPQDP